MSRNTMPRLIKYAFLSLFFITLSCKTAKEVQEEKLPKVKEEILMGILDSMLHQKVDYFYSKISTKVDDSTKTTSFKTSVRLKNDSVLNAIITYANIPIISAQLTTDSIYISNRRDKCFTAQSLEYLKKSFGVTFTSDNVEELILGFPVGYNPEHKYDQVDREGNYLLCSHKKREIKRNEKKEEREIITYYGISADLKSLEQIIIDSPEDTTVIKIDYLKREMVGNFLAPEDVRIEISTPRRMLIVELEYRKSRVDEEETIYFVIPEDYEECE